MKYDIYNEIPYKLENDEHNHPYLETYLVDSDNDTMILIFPGGGYCCHADHEGKGYADFFNSLGISCAVLSYRITPYKHPCPVLDARRAVRFIKENAEEFKINPEKIVLIGSSAGGHLAATTACYHSVDIIDEAEGKDSIDKNSALVAGIILCYPLISMQQHTLEWCVDNLITPDSNLHEYLSIEKSAGPTMPPAFIWHTLSDGTVDVRNSLMLATRYKEINRPCELHIFPDGCHGLGLAENINLVNQWPALCKNWLINYGFLSK